MPTPPAPPPSAAPAPAPPATRLPALRTSASLPSHLDEAPLAAAAAASAAAASAAGAGGSAASPRAAFPFESVRNSARRAILGDDSRSLRAALRLELARPPRVKALERASFVLGVAALVATQHVLLLHPRRFGDFYAALTVPLLALRFFQFRARKWGAFLLDFCYVVNALSLMHLYVLPDSPYLFELVFMLANGPLAWAVVLWRNSLVFHSPERLTSLHIHIMPPLLTYAQRWLVGDGRSAAALPPFLACVDVPAARQAAARAESLARAAEEARLRLLRATADAAAAASSGGSAAEASAAAEAPLLTRWQRWALNEALPAVAAWLLRLAEGGYEALLALWQLAHDALLSLWATAAAEAPAVAATTASAALSAADEVASLAREASAAAADAAAAASGASTFELPVFGNVTTTEFDAGVSVEAVASLSATCGGSFWRVMALPLGVYLAWQVLYFLATELPCCCCSCCCGAGRAAPGAGGASADASASADSDGAADATVFGGASSRRRRHLLADPSQETSLRWMIRREQEGALVRSALWLARRVGLFVSAAQRPRERTCALARFLTPSRRQPTDANSRRARARSSRRRTGARS